jgi:hypothetical protein
MHAICAGAVTGSAQNRLIANDFLEHNKLRIDGVGLMMQEKATGAPAIIATSERSA